MSNFNICPLVWHFCGEVNTKKRFGHDPSFVYQHWSPLSTKSAHDFPRNHPMTESKYIRPNILLHKIKYRCQKPRAIPWLVPRPCESKTFDSQCTQL